MEPSQDVHKEKFVKEVRSLLLKAGFGKEEVATQPPTAEGPDIIVTHTAEDKSETKIIIQCKCAEEKKEFSNLNNLIRTYSSYVREHKAAVALLILSGYDLPSKFDERKEMDRIRRREKVIYWGDRAYRYYKITTDVLRSPYARYLILRDLGYQISLQPKPYKVDAFQIRQHKKGPKMWIFSIEPEKLLSIAYVFRRGSRDPEAYQRILEPSRLSEIGKFLSRETSMLANNTIVAFDTKVKFRNGKLFIPPMTCSAWIVDGQHRLYGFCRIDKKVREEVAKKILKVFMLPVVGIEADPRLQAQLFTDINSKQRRINRNLLLDLYDHLDLEPEAGILDRIRIAKKLSNVDTFKGKIKILPRIEKGEITLASFVDYSKFKKLVNDLGRRSYSIINDFFNSVKEVFPEWDNSKEYVFSAAKGVRMLISLLTRIINYCERKDKKLDSPNVRFCLQKLKDACSSEPDYFKKTNYTGKALGAGAPDIVVRDLWAARIDSQLGGFLSEEEKQKIGHDEKKILLDLEEKLRVCCETVLNNLTPNWWVERVPPDVREGAEERKKKNEKPWPWFREMERPPHHYVNFSNYKKIITRRDNWKHFGTIFVDENITSTKLTELEPIRNGIAHNRKLNVEQFEHLKLYARDLILCIEAFEKTLKA